jgi:hypothetical protein
MKLIEEKKMTNVEHSVNFDRQIVVFVYFVAFCLAVFGLLSIPAQAWQYVPNWEKALFAFYFLVAFCGVLLAYWVYEDGKKIESLEERK